MIAKKSKMYIGGKWVDSTSGETFDDLNPYTGDVYAQVPAGTPEDARQAIDAAKAAFPEWSKTPPGERRAIFLKAADIMERRSDELVKAMMEEVGGTIGISMFQMHFVPGLYRTAASAAYEVKGEIIPADHKDSLFLAMRQPAGVVACVAPFNVPYILGSRSFTLPVAYGNTAVLKPSEDAPLTGGLLLAEIFEEAGLPAGVLNVITGTREAASAIGDEMISNPAVRRISFTGSTEVGRIIAEKAGRHLKRAVLELGGKDPLIILGDADVDYAVDAAVWGSFLHQGEICMSTERIIVEKSVAKEFIDKLKRRAEELPVGDPTNPAMAIGPLINQRAVDKVHAHVEEAVAGGAHLETGGRYDNLLYYPTVLTEVDPDMRVFREQTFGPVAPVVVVKDRDEALAVANNSDYGLSAGIITNDFTRALDMALRLETGMVHIGDQTVNDEPQAPFGGVKGSGYGRFGGQAALDEFTELRWINIQTRPRTFP
ncbi:MAG TPA: aldehyde dehydrogenase family protein [Acidimicrobiia bacterium]|nr:aldehyde dehydrogenase family protein [Acidimicrobiia bacterium]